MVKLPLIYASQLSEGDHVLLSNKQTPQESYDVEGNSAPIYGGF